MICIQGLIASRAGFEELLSLVPYIRIFVVSPLRMDWLLQDRHRSNAGRLACDVLEDAIKQTASRKLTQA